MRRRRRSRRRSQTEVELNLASMLDMAFQLLAFFILTFRPSPIEGELSLHLPAAVSIAKPLTAAPDGVDAAAMAVGFDDTLELSVFADENGKIASMKVGFVTNLAEKPQTASLTDLDQRLQKLIATPGVPAKQVLIRVAAGLRYEELMKVIDVCTRQKLPDGQFLRTINFTELNESPRGK